MMKAITGTQKKRGRPATGESQRVPVRLSTDQIGDLDLYCSYAGCSRSDVIREALDRWREQYAKELASMRGADQPWSDGEPPVARPIGSVDFD